MLLFCIYQHEESIHIQRLLKCSFIYDNPKLKKRLQQLKTSCPSTAVWMYGGVTHLCHGTTTNNKK